MVWNRSNTLALSDQKCCHCYGLGLLPANRRIKDDHPCSCVFRAIFRECHNRFRKCMDKAAFISRVSLEANPARRRKGPWGMKNQEYCADFLLVAKRTLGEESLAWRIFKWHHLLGADFRLVNRKLKRPTHRRETFHDIYRVEAVLGRAFAELEPHSLWPCDAYFASTPKQSSERAVHPLLEIETEREPARVRTLEGRPRRQPLIAPLAKAA